MPITENAPIQRYESGTVESVDDTLVTENHVAVAVNEIELIRTTCSPGRMREWVLGYLFSEGRIASPEDVEEIREADGRFAVTLVDSAPTEPLAITRVESGLIVGPETLLAAARTAIDRAETFRQTGGTHVMALVDSEHAKIANEPDFPASHEREAFVLAGCEDISRTCALEKVIGLALEACADFGRSVAFLSSRVPSRLLVKLARCGIPIIAAVSAPTIDAVRLAEELNVCLCGFVRGDRLNVYAHGWRVGL